MSIDHNKTVARRWFEEIFAGGNLALLDEVVAPGYRNHDPYAPPGGWPSGPEGARTLIQTYRTAFPDVRFEILDLVAEGDRVVTRWSATATHGGPLGAAPPTGRKVAITGTNLKRFTAGKVAEEWANFDYHNLLRQLGLLPSGAP
jgi:predicted ester cyclase